jgi:hypothetical protein
LDIEESWAFGRVILPCFLNISYISKLRFIHLLGWIYLLVLYDVSLSEQPSLQGSTSSTTQRGENKLLQQQQHFRLVLYVDWTFRTAFSLEASLLHIPRASVGSNWLCSLWAKQLPSLSTAPSFLFVQQAFKHWGVP